MALAALIAWLITAAGGFVMLGTWIAKGGQQNNSHLPPGVMFGHFALAAIGLVVWIIYLLAGSPVLAWIGFILLLPVAVLGLVMLLRWIPTYRAQAAGVGAPGADRQALAERHFPVSVVAAHGILAVATVVLALLAALGL